MAHNINFTNFDPNFRPSQTNRQSPTPATPYNYRSNPTVIVQQQLQQRLSPEAQQRISNYHNAAVKANQAADAIAVQRNRLKSYIADLENPSIANGLFFNPIKACIGQDLFKNLCEEVAHRLTGNRDATAGEHLLHENFRVILRIKNYDGETLLGQIESFYSSQLENYRGTSELNLIGENLERYKGCQQFSLSEAAKHRANAIESFKNLPPQAKGAICKKIYELDGGGDKGIDYGLNRALEEIDRVLLYRNESPLKQAITHCSTTVLKPQFNVTYIHNEFIRPTDSESLNREIRRLYELEDLQHFLADPYKYNDFIAGKYRNLSSETKDLLNRSIWLASYQPKELGFSENLVSRNPRVLLNIKNQQGTNVISQLIAHQQEKILGLRLHAEILGFNNASQNKNTQQILELFNQLSDKAKDDLRGRVWKRDGGERNPEMDGWKNFFGGWGLYGTRKIESDPRTLFTGNSVVSEYLHYLQNAVKLADQVILIDLETKNKLPSDPVDASAKKLANEPGLIDKLPPNLRVAYVTAELAGVASLGGLGSAVDGMARGFGVEKARMIMPLYQNGVIPNELLRTLRRKKKYEMTVDGQHHRVFQAKVNGLKCYLIDDPKLFWIPKKPDGTAGDFYDAEYMHGKTRWAVFQSAAAELIYKFSKKEHPFQLVHCHDAQTALIPTFLANRHPEEWLRGETPAALFTFHNNLDPNTYDGEETINLLQRHGLPKKGTNSLVEAYQVADMVTGVSETFSKEAQTPIFGNGMEHSVKVAAHKGKLVGIVNGNSNGWDPSKDAQLQNWKSVLEGPNKGQPIDLRFGPDSPDLGDKIVTCQRELCTYLKSLPFDHEAYADLDPTKPIVMYVGRYDSNQKGMEKFHLIMEETLKNGGQFVSVGVRLESDLRAKEIIEDLKKQAKERYNKKGVLIIDDKKENGKFKHQSVFGSLLRAATTCAIFPSKYEPCGLVQGELNRFGKKATATRTGGFVDTLKTEGPNANGHLFKRHDNWNSPEQDQDIAATLKSALNEGKALQNALHSSDVNAKRPHIESMRTISRDALNSTWEKTPDGSLSAIRLIDLAMAKAFGLKKERGLIHADLHTLKV